MNSKQLQYALSLSKIRNFSQVSEQFHISQPALSKQIIALENELGVRLFDRSTTPLTLTPAGESFVQKANELLCAEDVLIKTMERFRTGESGRLTIGLSSFRSLYMMPRTVRKLKERFPGLQVILAETDRTQRHKGILEGQYDFAITNLPVDESLLDVIPLEPDQLVLAVPQSLVDLIPDFDADPAVPVNLGLCRDLPFVAVVKQQEMRQLFDQLCRSAQLDPQIYVEVVGLATAWAMVKSGIGAAVLPEQFVLGDAASHNILLRPIQQIASPRQPVIVTRKGQYLSEYAEYAISLLGSSFR